MLRLKIGTLETINILQCSISRPPMYALEEKHYLLKFRYEFLENGLSGPPSVITNKSRSKNFLINFRGREAKPNSTLYVLLKTLLARDRLCTSPPLQLLLVKILIMLANDYRHPRFQESPDWRRHDNLIIRSKSGLVLVDTGILKIINFFILLTKFTAI